MSLRQLFSDIAAAIRAVDGTTAPITATDFPARIKMMSPPPPIYGVEWDGTETTAWTRTNDAVGFADPQPAVANGTGSSPFDNLMPWKGMVRVTDEVAGELVAIPKFYYKWTRAGTTLRLQIANEPIYGFYTSPAHVDRGDGKGERDVVYVGRYHCATGGSINNAPSKTGAKPIAYVTLSDARAGIHNLGETIWQFDYAMLLTIQMLYLVEYANWDSQRCIGYGCGNSELYATEAVGSTDGMEYHTGTKQNTRDTAGVGVQYRYIEGLWDNVSDYVDGISLDQISGQRIAKAVVNPSSFGDATAGITLGAIPTVGIITEYGIYEKQGIQWLLPVSADGGSNSTHTTDIWEVRSSLLCHGGNYQTTNLARGLFSMWSGDGKAYSVGCRLMKLP